MEHIDVFNTHIECYPYKKNDYPVIEQMYEAIDFYSGQPFPCGYFIHDGKLYIPRGTSISKLRSITEVKPVYVEESDPYEPMSCEHTALYEPRDDLQEKSIKFLEGREHQLSLNLLMGLGKTFCVAYASTQLSIKTLVITPNEAIKQQWIKTYTTMFDYKPKHLINVAGSAVMNAILNDEVPPADVYVVNHQTLHSFITSEGPYQFHNFFKKIKVGIKVYDESHLDFANILLIDSFTNTDRTWYLTATFDRSDKSESLCFKKAFQSVIEFGYQQSVDVTRKHVIYHTVNINSRVSPQNRAKLMAGPSFTAAKYGHYAFFDDPGDTCYKAILTILEKTKNLEGKTMIFIPLIDAVDLVVKKLKKDFPDKSCGAWHSRISAEEKESTEKKDIIVTTIKSSGTGRDVKGLRVIISAEPVASRISTSQTLGRLREYAPDKDTYYFDIVDVSIPPCNWWWKARTKKIQELAKQMITLVLD